MPKRAATLAPQRTAKATTALPRSWPDNIGYITEPVYSTTLCAENLQLLNAKPVSIPAIPSSSGPCPRVRITLITSLSHPAYGQHGLFAAQHLVPDSFVLFYLGFVHGEADSDPCSNYDLSLDRELGVGVDATKMGNEARFTNDYRGVNSFGPNAEFKEVWVHRGIGRYEKRMAVYVLPAGKSGKRAKGIGKGEEILVSYGKGFWREHSSDGTDK